PAFVWQATLILLPVVVLAVFGLLSLRQDKILAQLEATERAQVIADDLAPKIWAELDTAKPPDDWTHPSFQVDREGRMIFPPPSAVIPDPKPFHLSELN